MPYSSSTGEQVAATTSSIEDRQASTGADLLLSLAETATAAAWGNTKLGGSKGSVTPSPVSSSLKEWGVSGKRVKLSRTKRSSSPLAVSSGTAPLPSHLESVDAQESKKRVGTLSGIDQIVAASVKRARAERIVTNDEEESREEKSSNEQEKSPNEQARNSAAEKKDGGDGHRKGSRQPVISPSSSDESQQTPAEGEGKNTAQINGSAGTSHHHLYYHPQSYYPNAHHGFGRPMHYMQPTPYGHPAYGYAPPPPPMSYYGMMPAMHRVQPPMAPASLHSSSQPPPATSPSPRVKATTAPPPSPPPPPAAAAASKRPNNYRAALGKDHTDLKKSSRGETLSNSKRCVPLKHPMSTKCWGQDNDSTQDVKLPDFCQLVNFPEYLARARGGGGGGEGGGGDAKSSSAAAAEGKRHCVMCGKPRVCSASSSVAGRSRTVTDTDAEGSLHIIPRQNKGVCTACDVTVWAVQDRDNLEIKWCKGCKNFRPWVAFGEKGMATKCVRCRTRQKEKYAAAKVGAVKRGNQ